MTYYRRGDPGGKGLTREEYPSRWPSKIVKEKALSRMDGDIKELMKSLTNVNDRMSFYRLATEHVSRALLNVCQMILHGAVERAPYETGQLRSSGLVVLRTGQKQTENYAIDVRADHTGEFELRRWIQSIKRPAALLTAEISFDRIDRGRDVALWTHEELLDYEERAHRPVLMKALERMEKAMGVPEENRRTKIFIATKEGTGPKYLQEAYDLWVGYIPDRLAAAVEVARQEYNKKTGQRVRRR